MEDNEELSYSSEAYAAELWERLKWHLPPKIDGRRAAGLHDLLYFYKYASGHGFEMQQDARIQHGTAFSYYTLIIFLNDDYGGGLTKFRSGESIEPQKGSALFFEQGLDYEAEVVTEGIKYVMRADIMYQ